MLAVTLRFTTSVAVMWLAFAATADPELVHVPWTSDLFGMVIAVIAAAIRCTEMILTHKMVPRHAIGEIGLAILAGLFAHTIAVEVMEIRSARMVWTMCAAAGFLGSVFLAMAMERIWPGVKLK